MCVCISHTCLTLNNKFQTKMGCWGSRNYAWCARFRAARVCIAAWTSGEVADIGGGRKARGGNARRDHVARVVPLSVAAHLMVQGVRRLARCRVDAVTAVGVRSPPSAKTSRLTSLPSASRCEHGSAPELPYSFGDYVPVRGAETISAIGVKCGAPAVEFVQRDAEQLACPGRRKLPSSDVSEDGVLSRTAPAFACAGVFGGEGHSSPHRMITSPRLSAWPLPSRSPTTPPEIPTHEVSRTSFTSRTSGSRRGTGGHVRQGGRYRRLHQHIRSRGRRRIRISCHDRTAHSGCYDRPDAW